MIMERLMVKTTPLNDETHKCLKVAQTNLYEKYNIQIPIPDMIAAVIYDADQIVKTVLEKKGLVNIQFVGQEDVCAEK
jgi:hypothetical protein